MVDNVQLAGRLFDFKSAAQVKVNDPGLSAVTAWRRSVGSEGAAVDATADLSLPVLVAGTWVSPLQRSAGLTHIAFAVTSTQGGSVVLNKYLDPLGQIAAGSATAAMTANAALVLDHSSSSLLQSFSIAINNTAAQVATLSSALCVLAK
jgi:hypothetical protein